MYFVGANINQCDACGNAPVNRALRQGWIDVVDFLLDHQCDVNIVPANGNDCLTAAVKCDKVPIDALAKRLLKTSEFFINYCFCCHQCLSGMEFIFSVRYSLSKTKQSNIFVV